MFVGRTQGMSDIIQKESEGGGREKVEMFQWIMS